MFKSDGNRKSESHGIQDNNSSKTILKYITIGAAALVTGWLGIHILFGVDTPFYVVVSDSMIPTLKVGDLVIINSNVPFNKLQVGDIIVFTTPGKTTEGIHKIIIHRIAGILYGAQTAIRTKGDANPSSIPLLDYPIREQNYIGKVEIVLPKLGMMSTLLRSS
ncbi:MAG TPA: signal peptidase I [Nitrososphaeraceae archaeon]